MKIEFHTFDEMLDVLARNTPHALMLDWWARLERAIREYGRTHGYREHLSVYQLIENALSKEPLIEAELIEKIHQLRKRRNDIAHGSDLGLTAQEAEEFARRCWEIGCYVYEFCEQRVA